MSRYYKQAIERKILSLATNQFAKTVIFLKISIFILLSLNLSFVYNSRFSARLSFFAKTPWGVPKLKSRRFSSQIVAVKWDGT